MASLLLRQTKSALALIGRSAAFVGIWLLTAAILFGVLFVLGAVPQSVQTAGEALGARWLAGAGAPAPAAAWPARPTSLVIPAIGMNAAIIFPENPATDALNSALARGVVHYPRSAMPGGAGSVILMAHSSALPVVRNQAYRSFNRLGELSAGAAIAIRSDGGEYRYRVSSVENAAASAASIALDDPAPRLILFTCNVFGKPEERIVVTAEPVGSYPLPNAEQASAADTSSQP